MTAWAPNFLVIGAYKAGTTTLHHALREQPGIFVPSRKEPNHFAFVDGAAADHPASSGSVRAPAAYAALFADASDEAITGEVSPAYLAVPGTADRIARARADVRLVAVLRNPLERAWSDYLMYVRDGLEHQDVVTALDEQEQRRAQGLPTGHYVETGRYAAQLEPYLARFDRDQILLLRFEDLVSDQHGTMGRLLRHVGSDADPVLAHDRAFNVSGIPRGPAARALMAARHRLGPTLRDRVPTDIKYGIDRLLQRRLDRPDLPDAARSRLLEELGEDMRRLASITGWDLTDWR